jgi:Holliday junction resolvase
MPINSREKGARVETQIRDVLRKLTKLNWERVPGSGALDPVHKLKGDLYVPEKKNIYCVEVKGYADDHISSQLLTSKNPQLLEFWKQTVRQAEQVKQEPLLVFKFDRSKIFVSFKHLPKYLDEYRYIFVNVDKYEFYIALLEDWLKFENPQFVS